MKIPSVCPPRESRPLAGSAPVEEKRLHSEYASCIAPCFIEHLRIVKSYTHVPVMWSRPRDFLAGYCRSSPGT